MAFLEDIFEKVTGNFRSFKITQHAEFSSLPLTEKCGQYVKIYKIRSIYYHIVPFDLITVMRVRGKPVLYSAGVGNHHVKPLRLVQTSFLLVFNVTKAT